MSRAAHATRTRARSTAWVGWVWFAACMMIMTGSFNAVYGLVALLDDGYYTVGPQGLLVFDLTQWGWILLIFGALAMFAGIALLSGALWARITTVALASINMLAHMAFSSAQPVWALITIVLDVLVIWAVIVHGDELKGEIRT